MAAALVAYPFETLLLIIAWVIAFCVYFTKGLVLLMVFTRDDSGKSPLEQLADRWVLYEYKHGVVLDIPNISGWRHQFRWAWEHIALLLIAALYVIFEFKEYSVGVRKWHLRCKVQTIRCVTLTFLFFVLVSFDDIGLSVGQKVVGNVGAGLAFLMVFAHFILTFTWKKGDTVTYTEQWNGGMANVQAGAQAIYESGFDIPEIPTVDVLGYFYGEKESDDSSSESDSEDSDSSDSEQEPLRPIKKKSRSKPRAIKPRKQAEKERDLEWGANHSSTWERLSR